jgi:hypothetical protein
MVAGCGAGAASGGVKAAGGAGGIGAAGSGAGGIGGVDSVVAVGELAAGALAPGGGGKVANSTPPLR